MFFADLLHLRFLYKNLGTIFLFPANYSSKIVFKNIVKVLKLDYAMW